MPDYAEVAGCSTFKNTQSPLYDSYGAYATTNLVRNMNLFTNPHYPNIKNNSIYSAPSIYNDQNNGRNFMHSDTNFLVPKTNGKTATSKMNIIENKMDAINNLNRSTQSVPQAATTITSTTTMNNAALDSKNLVGIKSVPSTPLIGLNGTVRRNRLPKIGHCDKISFGGCDSAQNIEQPLFIKSKEDGSWTSIQNSAYHFSQISSPINASNNNINTKNGIGSDANKYKINASNNSINNINNNSSNLNNSISNINNVSSSNQIQFSSFGRADNV